MEPLLFLAHRIPYPPNKGDKIRSYHLFREMAERHRVFLGTFIDDPADEKHVEVVEKHCAGIHIERIAPARARIASLRGLLTGEALTLPYYRNRALSAWVDATLRQERIEKTIVYSSAMAQYLPRRAGFPTLLDFVDVDSAKWTQYADSKSWPMSWIYRREGKRLLSFERQAAALAQVSTFATEDEAKMFRAAAPEVAATVHSVVNGVDTTFFSVDAARPSPYENDVTPIVFTGAMDYWPNIEAAEWFARQIMPIIMAACPSARFIVVGMNPAAAVLNLTQLGYVTVTGRVPDVRPYVQHARVAVAPLQIARGVQNKVLEAMALARPVVTTTACGTGVGAKPGVSIEYADSPDAFARTVLALIDDPRRGDRIGAAARLEVENAYQWSVSLAKYVRLLGASSRSDVTGAASGTVAAVAPSAAPVSVPIAARVEKSLS